MELGERSSVGRSFMIKAWPPSREDLRSAVRRSTVRRAPTNIIRTPRENLRCGDASSHSELVRCIMSVQPVDTAQPRQDWGLEGIRIICTCRTWDVIHA
jgi:hypothetical protein